MARSASAIDPVATADAVHSAAIHVLRRVRQEDARTGIGPGRLSALSVLAFGGPMRLTDLARAEQVRPPTMTRIVAALEGQGLVRRRRATDDARATILEATVRGAKVMKEGRRRRVDRLASALQRLSPNELDLLARAAALLEKVSKDL